MPFENDAGGCLMVSKDTSRIEIVIPHGRGRALTAALGIALAVLAGIGGAAAGAAPAQAGEPSAAHAEVSATTAAYVAQFYPLWFTFYQSQYATRNRLVGPDRVSELYQIVVAINVDTLYASTFVDVTEQPIVISIPATGGAYSVLNLDPYGTIFDSGIPSQSPNESLPAATYALTSPDYFDELPAGVIPIRMPLDVTTLIVRADRFTPDGDDQSAAANEFRAAITMKPLCAYQNLPCPEEPNKIPGYDTLIFPEIAFAVPFKTVADALVKFNAIEFLKQLQFAVASDQTPPMTPAEQALSDAFDAAFGDGEIDDEEMRSAFIEGAQAAHQAILNSYLDNRGPTNWIHFTNMGDWGDRVVERAAITEFIQYGNSIKTAAYYHAFRDRNGVPLDAWGGVGYVLTFAADQIPAAKRFWSITAYTPQSIELVANSADKYVVASYTPGLEYNPDGSLSVYLGTAPPKGVPEANWLPAPPGPFNIMLRVYGVEPNSSIANDTYVPPGIQRVDRPQVRVPFPTRPRVPFRPR
jgi:hypothetical protein